MTKKSLFVGATALIITAATLAPQVMAYRSNPNITGPNYSVERHDAMEKAFETNNYNAWKEQMASRGGRVSQVINEQNFPKFAQAHKLAKEGKITEANAIRSELGLGGGYGRHQ